MKDINTINEARLKLSQRIKTVGLSDQQGMLIVGMLNALVWVADGKDATTMERVLNDEPFNTNRKESIFKEYGRLNG